MQEFRQFLQAYEYEWVSELLGFDFENDCVICNLLWGLSIINNIQS